MAARRGDAEDPDLDAVESDFTTPADPDVETGAESDQPA
jgi:hypothetical protein